MGSQWFVVSDEGEQQGPIEEQEVLDMIRCGRLHAQNLCWCESMSQWAALGAVEPFRDHFPGDTGGKAKVADTAKRGLGELRKAFDRTVEATKKKTKTAGSKLKIRQHEKRKRDLLSDLGKLVYERSESILSQAPYTEKVNQIRREDEEIGRLQEEIELGEQGKPEPSDESKEEEK